MIDTDILRCSHRHTRYTHPFCFEKIRKEWVVKPRQEQIREIEWYENPDLKIGFLDIETTGLEADTGYMVCWSIKERGETKVIMDWLKKEEVFNYKFDRRITTSLVDTMRQFDVLVTYNGILFDCKYIRTRAFYWKIDFPKWKELLHIDLYWKARNLFRLSHTTLNNVTKLLAIDGKTKLDFSYWGLAGLGNPKAMKQMLKHNKADVEILELAFNEIKEYCKFDKRGL